MLKEEIDDMFLANAGKCPKCGEFLYIEQKGKRVNECYLVFKKCLSDDCDYSENISNAYNEAMGIKQSKLDQTTKEEPFVLPNDILKRDNYPYSFYKIDDVIEHEIKCPYCGSVDSFDINYEISIRELVYVCNECHTKFKLKDMDFSTGIGIFEII